MNAAAVPWVGSTLPSILGVRHHSPACARLVAASIRALRPAYVLIEGPADFNARLDELYLPHRLPLAIYSYLSDGTGHRGSWSPFAEHSPEWQALLVAREVGAQVRFIDLPAWHDALSDLPNRYADAADDANEALAEAYERALANELGIEGRDALWDHLFEAGDVADGAPDEALAERLRTYFEHLRNDDPGSACNREREQMMARWIAWAMARDEGPVFVVCGGYHAPALARLWREALANTSVDGVHGLDPPETPAPSAQVDADRAPLRFGSYLVPYSYKRLDAFTGYASGMSSPAYYQWVWERGSADAGALALRQVLVRLREKGLPASTADFIAVHTRAQALARLRGHAAPLRSDWLDAIAGSLLKDALDAPLPWSYRGPIRAGTDPILVEVMDVLAGAAAGALAAGTPQPPLVRAVEAELQALGIDPDGEPDLDLLEAEDRARSRALHRLAILAIPGVERVHGPSLALSGERRESWRLRSSLEQHAALIEAGAYGPTLHDAARARLEEQLRGARGRVAALAQTLNRAAFAALSSVSSGLLADLRAAIADEPSFEAIGEALSVLYPLLRHGQMLEIAEAPVLRAVIEAAFDRALWLLEPPAAIGTADVAGHIRAVAAIRDIARDALAAGTQAMEIEPVRAIAVLRRKVSSVESDPLSRGAALGTVLSLEAGHSPTDGDLANALDLLSTLVPARMGDALSGLVALARDVLAQEEAFVAGLDRLVQRLDEGDFVLALPAMRAAFAWLPTRERGQLAQHVLQLHDAEHLPRRVLTQRLQGASAEAMAAATAVEQRVQQQLAAWGVLSPTVDGTCA
ncbi:hypothetical protein H0E84_03660 [Luteimonas sp. SJ-92]|uniref:Uncharacterized protein n=1 Tax=Luteimonas salinisoli TaxID=2752307 RepID=A0A853J9W3_9GAMM|nr:DUF5682 family protein [Luteimonas salinisoli]NZA25469.1 hypothetical protein [Luteimonas salinisoli]